MPEIKNTFVKGKMNKDLDERLIPNGEYVDAMNVQVSTSDSSSIGTIQNILGNERMELLVPSDCQCVGSVADEKNNKLYWFVKRTSPANGPLFDAIFEYSPEDGAVPVMVDTRAGSPDAVLKFPNKIITGINIIDDILLWTDGVNEPRKINIEECKKGTVNINTHTQLSYEQGSFAGLTIEVVGNIEDDNGNLIGGGIHTTIDDGEIVAGRYFYYSKAQMEEILNLTLSDPASDHFVRHYRDGNFLGEINCKFFFKENFVGNGTHARLEDGPNVTGNSWYNENRTFQVGDIIFGNNITYDIREEHITVIKKVPKNSLSVKINSSINSSQESLFELKFPRFSYRYKYIDNQYSAFAPFTDIVFNPEHEENQDTVYSIKEPYNKSMVNKISSIELSDFVTSSLSEDVKQVDILYKEEDSNLVYSIASIKRDAKEWHLSGSNEGSDPGHEASSLGKPHYRGGLSRGKYIVNSENINAALPENQLLRPWDNVPRKALAQEITGNRIVYGNYTQGYNPQITIPRLVAGYDFRSNQYNFDEKALPSLKSQRNYQMGFVLGDKYGRETPVFTSSDGAINIPWRDQNSLLSASQSYQLKAKIDSDIPSFAEYIKYFVKEGSSEYYNLLMDKAYFPAAHNSFDELKDHIWLSFPSSERNKVEKEDYLILKKKIGTGETQIELDNKFHVLDIKNEVPDAIKYEFITIGEVNHDTNGTGNFFNTTALFPSAPRRPDKETTSILIKGTEWTVTGKCGQLPSSDSSTRTEPGFGQHYMFWSDGGQNSERYIIISSVYTTDEDWRLTLDRTITALDAAIFDTTSSTFRIEHRKEKNLELFSGKFFVKVKNASVLYNDGVDDEALLDSFVVSAQQKTWWLADQQNASNDYDGLATAHDEGGIINAEFNTTMPADDNVKEEYLNDNWNTTSTEWRWGEVHDGVVGTSTTHSSGDGFFFIDNMYMCAGQISDNNYAKNAGQTWQGGGATYNNYEEWLPISSVNGTTDPQMAYENGWSVNKNNRAQYISLLSNPETAINGLEGIMVSQSQHVNTPYNNGWRNWRVENASQGLYDTKVDNTYDSARPPVSLSSSNGTAGKFFMHFSFLAPGEDLNTYTQTTYPGDTITGTSSLAYGLQGIWGGGVFTSESMDAATSTGFGLNDDFFTVPMEGNEVADNYISIGTIPNPTSPDFQRMITPPGPGLNYTYGYDSNYADRHNNQWNPAWPSDPGGEIQAFINNLQTGNKFKFDQDTSNTIYTIKSVSIKKIYNHTSWRARKEYDGTGVEWTGVFSSSIGSVEEAAIDWADTLDSGGANGNATKLEDFKGKIIDFGKKSNRRVCYILELDKNPAASSSYNPVNGTNIDANTNHNIQFLTSDPTVLLQNINSKPLIWETEPRKDKSLDIYHEASPIIPTKINYDTREIFAPVGCKVEILNLPTALNGNITITDDVVLNEWGSKIVTEEERVIVLKPGFNFEDVNTDEIDYSNVRLRFHRQDGTYTTAVLPPQPGPGQPLYDGGTNGYKTSLVMPTEIGANMEVAMSWHNAFSFGNGIESNRIRDDFNQIEINNGPIVSTTTEVDYQQEERKNGLIYSGIYNSNSGVNNLNQFIMAEKSTKDLNPTYGSIQKLFQRRVGLVAFCEDKVVDIIAGKDTLFNADGNPQLIASNKVLGTATPFVGDFGISQNPESFAQESYRAYFTDKQRGTVLRLSMDGLTPISDIGMRDWFRDNLLEANELIGTYDEYKKDYNLSLTNYFPENLLKNADISEGEQLINVTPPAQNLIENYLPISSSAFTTPDVTTFLDNITLTNRNLSSSIEITNHPEILEGSIVAEDPGTVALPSNDAEFISEPPSAALVDLFIDLRTFSQANYNSGQNPFTHHTTNNPLDYKFKKQWGTNYSTNHSNSHNMSGSGFLSSSQTAEYIGSYNATQNSNINSGSTSQTSSISNNWGDTDGYGIYHFIRDEEDGVVIPYEPKGGGAMPNNLVEADVLSNVGSNGASYPTANNFTCFYGEEILVQVVVSPVLASNDYIPFEVVLMDGLSVVDSSKIIFPNVPGTNSGVTANFQDIGGPIGYGYNISSYLTNYPHAGNTDWYGAAYQNDYSIYKGWTTGSTVSFQPPQDNSSNTYSNYPNGLLYNITGNSPRNGKRFMCTFRVKFNKPGSGNTTTNSEGVAVNNLNIKVKGAVSNSGTTSQSSTRAFFLNSVRILKEFRFSRPENPGTTAINPQPPIPPANVPAWTELETTLDPVWTFNDFGGATYEIAVGATTTYGLNTGVTSNSAIDNSGTTHNWLSGSSNGMTSFNQYSDGTINFGSDDIYIDTTSGSLILTQSAVPELGASAIGKWFMVDVIAQEVTTLGQVTMTNVSEGVIPSFNPSTSGALYYPNQDILDEYHFGNYIVRMSGANQKFDWGLIDTSLYPADQLGGVDLVTINNSYSNYTSAINTKLLRGVFKMQSPSTNNLSIYFQGFKGTIKHINLVDISDIITGGNASDWSVHDNTPIVNSFSTRKLWCEGNNFIFNNATSPDQVLQQEFVNFQLQSSTDGYELIFIILNMPGGSGDLLVQLRSYTDGTTSFEGIAIEVDGNGYYVARFNMDGTTESITKNGVPYSGTFEKLSTYDPSINFTNTAESNLIRIHSVDSLTPFTGKINTFQLTDTSNIITGGAIDAWDFFGFDPLDDDYISFNNGVIQLNDAFSTMGVSQVITRKLKRGEKYRIRFSHNITQGEIRFYYFNSEDGAGMLLDGNILTEMMDLTTGINPTQGSYYVGQLLPETPGYYDKIHEVGEMEPTHPLFSFTGIDPADIIYDTFVIQVMNNGTFGTLDNFSMQRIVDFEPITITFNEDIKGWVSFKSFIPENGISLSKQYYTMNEGALFQHHKEIDASGNSIPRNLFYSTDRLHAIESSVTTVFNDEPSLIKIFNTLNYEGSQSRILEPEQGNGYELYNISGPAEGWYAEYVKTNTQDGTVNEFIEKEGKWFNYIKGGYGMRTSDLGFQGLGIIYSVN